MSTELTGTIEETQDDQPALAEFDLLQKLNKDLKQSAKLLDRNEVRFLVDFYYQIQDKRIQAAAQVRETSKTHEPNKLLDWCGGTFRTIERNIKTALDIFTKEYTVGNWLQSITGIGPVISAGLMANLEVSKAPTYGGFWRFAGLDPTVKWPSAADAKTWLKEESNRLKEAGAEPTVEMLLNLSAKYWGRSVKTLLRYMTPRGKDEPTMTLEAAAKAIARRPWNLQLKTLTTFKLGECFVKVQNNDKDVYGKMYAKRKRIELERNIEFKYKEQAEQILRDKNFGKDTEAYKHLSIGMLPPAQIHARARRWAVKLLLAHLHHVMYEDHYGEKPRIPYPFEKLHHTMQHYLAPPNWDEKFPRAKNIRQMDEIPRPKKKVGPEGTEF